jgi:hypothetical protein
MNKYIEAHQRRVEALEQQPFFPDYSKSGSERQLQPGYENKELTPAGRRCVNNCAHICRELRDDQIQQIDNMIRNMGMDFARKDAG